MQILEEQSIKFTIIEYLKNPPTEKELIEISKALKLKPCDFIRKGEKIYKELNVNKNLNNAQKLYQLIIQHPILLERPIIINNNKAVIGRPPDNILSII